MDDRHELAEGFGSAALLSDDSVSSPSLPTGIGGVIALNAVERVAEVMREYADRGVFEDLDVAWTAGEAAQFDFGWLYGQPYTLQFDPSTHTLSFCDLLPRIEAGLMMHGELEAFLKGRSHPDLPEHRRVDEALATLSGELDDGILSLKLQLRGPHYEYGTRKLINLVHETFFVHCALFVSLDDIRQTSGLWV